MQGFEHGEDPPQDEPLELSFDDGASSKSEGAPEPGNRPAQNARVISPGEAFQDDWTGGEGAGDFLELEGELGQEFRFDDPAPAETAAAQAAASARLELDDAPAQDPGGTAGLMAVPSAPEGDMLDPEFQSGLVPSEDPALYEEDGEYDDEYEDDEYDDELQPAAPRRGLALKLVAGFVVGLGMAVGMNQIDLDGLFGSQPAPIELGTTATAPGAGAQGQAGPEGPVAGTDGAPRVPSGDSRGPATAADVAPAEGPPGGLIAEWVALMPAPSAVPGSFGTEPEVLASSNPVPVVPTEFLEPPAVGDSGSVAAATGSPTTVPGGEPVPEDAMVITALESEPVQRASGVALAGSPTQVLAMLDGVTHILQSSEVPLDRIDSPVQIMTPTVGLVRAELTTGDVFEGRLYSVGTGRVWVDTQLGRMGLRGENLESLERITNLGGALAAQDIGGLNGKQVRALTSGGRFVYGMLLRTRDGRATLRTAGGGRITVDEASLELVGNHPTVRLK